MAWEKNILAHDSLKKNILALKVTEKNILARLKNPGPPPWKSNGRSLRWWRGIIWQCVSVG